MLSFFSLFFRAVPNGAVLPPVCICGWVLARGSPWHSNKALGGELSHFPAGAVQHLNKQGTLSGPKGIVIHTHSNQSNLLKVTGICVAGIGAPWVRSEKFILKNMNKYF